MTIIVTADLVYKLYPFVSKEETRYYLSGIHVEPHPDGGTFLVATDDRRMGIFYDRLATCASSAIIRLPPTMIAACRQRVGDKKMRFLSVSDKTALLHEHPIITTADELEHELITPDNIILGSGNAIIDGTFPEWRRVVPKKFPSGNVGVISVNPKYMGDFNRIGSQVTMHMEDDRSPVFVMVGGQLDFIGVLMPMLPKTWTEYPSWLNIKPPRKAPAKKRPTKAKKKSAAK